MQEKQKQNINRMINLENDKNRKRDRQTERQ